MLATFETTSPAGSPAHIVAGALAHLATHLDSGCPRAARLAALLLDRLAEDDDADVELRHHAGDLAAALQRSTGAAT